MKRGLAALIIFCLCIVFSLYCTEKTKDVLENTKRDLNEISVLCKNGENKTALEKARRLEGRWNKERFILKITREHSSVRETENAVASVPGLIENSDFDKATEKCFDAITEIEYILDSEKLSLENLF